MPHDHEKNYGFTQFALELNELTPELRRVLPSTDTRLRPDQRSAAPRHRGGGAEAAQLCTAMCAPHRYLEEGNVPAAETQKRQIEQLQRDRRRVMEENNITHQARFFRSGGGGWGGPRTGVWRDGWDSAVLGLTLG